MNSSSDSDDSVDNLNKDKSKRLHKGKKIQSLKKKKVETESKPEQAKSDEKEGKTLLEILELEMKAKAIRVLLGPNQTEYNTQIEEAIKNEIATEVTNEKSDEDKSWDERYKEREDVKEVIKTSRLCANMRRRMLLYQQKVIYINYNY